MELKGKTDLEISQHFKVKYDQEVIEKGLTDLAKVYYNLSDEYYAKHISSSVKNFNQPKKSFFTKIKEALF